MGQDFDTDTSAVGAPSVDAQDAVAYREGDVLAGMYRVERVIGAGGSGVVVSAIHLALGTRVAVKLLANRADREPELVARFLREAHASARIQSDHAARVLDVGKLESGAPYIAFEYLDGIDLAELIARDGPLTIARAIGYVLEACEAIAEAHALGIVHRDIKPENLFLATRRGRPIVKVIDFGISKVSSSSWIGAELSLTRSQTVIGSPKYMAPEQLRAARSADPRSDIWSIGVVLYELLVGHGPFEADTLADLCAAVLKEEPAPLDSLREDVPAELGRIVSQCLRKPPAERFPDVAALARALAPFGTDAALESCRSIERVLAEHPALVSSVAPTAASVPPVPSKTLRSASRHASGTFAGWQRAHAPAGGASLARAAAMFAIGVAVTVVAWSLKPQATPHDAAHTGLASAVSAVEDSAARFAASVEPPSPPAPPPAQAKPQPSASANRPGAAVPNDLHGHGSARGSRARAVPTSLYTRD